MSPVLRRICRTLKRGIGGVIAVLAVTTAAAAQPTNLTAYQDLAVRCLSAAPDTVRVFRLDAPAAMPYLRTALIDRWLNDGRRLYLPDSTAGTPPLPRLAFVVEEAGVTYARARRGRLRRTVTLALRYTLSGADGRLLHEDRCRDTLTDVIRRDARTRLESAAFSETQAEPPGGGWVRRYFEPALLAAATAVTAYLFFNLRSERTGE